MALGPGTRLGAYEILTLLGSGGMGEVYRARDRKLNREVAVKVLPESLVTDPERLARFSREAQVLAALNHPNIAHIHGFEDSTGVPALVIELVEGPTLADRIARGPIPFDEALPIAVQIAEALEAAHEQGIIHRDLKPANVKVRTDGTVKVLDFGLAKAMTPIGPTPANVSLSPTLTSPAGMTGVGMILGTAPYMSPEQARGQVADRRADIWAFGCVLFEMLTGRKTFSGETVTDILAAVVRAEPDWQALPQGTPVSLRSLLQHCLRKDQTRRFHHIADARIEIEDIAAGPAPAIQNSAAPIVPARRTIVPPWALVATLALVALLVLGLFVASRRDGRPPGAVTRLELSLPPGVELPSNGANGVIAISPAGDRVAFVGIESGIRRAYLRNLDLPETRPLGNTQGAMLCFFAPDGATLGVILNTGAIEKVSLTDGTVVPVASSANILFGATWTSADRIVYVHAGALWDVPASGGTPRQLTTLNDKPRETTHRSPVVLPGGKSLLFMAVAEAGSNSEIDSLDLASGERRTIVRRAASPLYARSGHLVFLRDGELLAAPFNVERLALTGPPALLEKVPSGQIAAAASDAGSFVTGSNSTGRLVWVTRHGVEQPVNETARNYDAARLSPDGLRLAVRVDTTLWIQDLSRNTFAPVTNAQGAFTSFPTWTPDGRRLVYFGGREIRSVSSDGVGPSEPVAGTLENDRPTSISPDGRTLAFQRFDLETSGDVYVTPLDGSSQPRPVLRTAAYEGGGRFSPDGRWMAYVSDESGPAQIYLRPVQGPQHKWQVSTEGGAQPAWSRSGAQLFYRDGDKLMVVDVATGSEPGLSQPRLLFEKHYSFGNNISIANYDIAPDDERFLMIKEATGAGHLNIVLNWFEELKVRVPTK